MGLCWSSPVLQNALWKQMSEATPGKYKNASAMKDLKLPGKVTRVYDGDTVFVAVSYHNQIEEWSVRLSGINAPELKTEDLVERIEGYRCKKALEKLVLDKIVMVHTQGKEKYGRLLGTLLVPARAGPVTTSCLCDLSCPEGHHWLNINDFMLQNTPCMPYDGKSKKQWRCPMPEEAPHPLYASCQ